MGSKIYNQYIIVKSAIKIDDSKVKEEIKKEFERHARIDASRVKVDVEGTKITLKGTVSNFDELDIAEDAAWSIPGVNKVENLLRIE